MPFLLFLDTVFWGPVEKDTPIWVCLQIGSSNIFRLSIWFPIIRDLQFEGGGAVHGRSFDS